MHREREWHQVGELINNPRSLPPVEEPPRAGSGLVVQRYGKTRWWAVYRDGELLVVAVYKKGAERIVRELQGSVSVKANPFGPPKKYRFAKGMRVRMIGQQFQTGLPFGTEGTIVQRRGALGMGIYSDPDRIMIWVSWDTPASSGRSQGRDVFAVFHWELEPVSAKVIPITQGKRRSNPGKSICVCGHSGDGPHSQHEDTIAAGHGRCMFCACPKFTWKRYRRAGETDPEHPEYTKLMQRVRKKNARRSQTVVTPARGRSTRAKPFEVWVRKSDQHPWGFVKAFADYHAALALAEQMGERAFYAKVTGPVLEAS